MNHAEKVAFHRQSETYIGENQMRELMQNALLDLVLNQPEEPLDHLIDFIKARKSFKVFSVVGFPEEIRKSVLEEVADQHNLKIVKADPPVEEGQSFRDHNDYSSMLSKIASYQGNYEGVIFDNFPSNKNQLKQLKKNKIICDRIFYVSPASQQNPK